MYSKRIKWLMECSRKSFGLVKGENIAVLIDSSDANMRFGRAVELQDSLLVNKTILFYFQIVLQYYLTIDFTNLSFFYLN
jgi:hypothetical protein